jgi:hypothetical protein
MCGGHSAPNDFDTFYEPRATYYDVARCRASAYSGALFFS